MRRAALVVGGGPWSRLLPPNECVVIGFTKELGLVARVVDDTMALEYEKNHGFRADGTILIPSYPPNLG